ncbi:MAG: hypothetical protein DRN71_01465 [Candidatus Nanohalarchaeota archaeon]|nr:MAG: hypothetical protein DRN71_01465 [Candidatus Nanohaloarchaeota archaeon]
MSLRFIFRLVLAAVVCILVFAYGDMHILRSHDDGAIKSDSLSTSVKYTLPAQIPDNGDTASGANLNTENVYFVQVDAKTVVKRGADAVVSDLVAGGANIVALQVFSDEDIVGVYWDSDIAPVREDILGDFVSVAHENGLSVFAWMTTLDVPWIYDKYPRMRLKRNDNGKITANTGWYKRISPCSDEHRAYIVDVFAEITQNYDIDGILLQDDLYWGSDEVFDGFTRDEYFKYTDRVLTVKVAQGDAFHRWKSERLGLIVKEVNDAIKAINPEIKVAVNVYAECALDEPWCLSSFGQDYDALSMNSDCMVIMAYHVLTGKPPEWVGDVTKAALARERAGKQTIIKVQVVDWVTDRMIELPEVSNALAIARTAGAKNVGFYLSGRSMREVGIDFSETG